MQISASQNTQLRQLSESIKDDLLNNILPFWYQLESGKGFSGALGNDLKPIKDSPVALVMMTRLLWTYSRAYRMFGSEEYAEFARNVYDYILTEFIDKQAGGYFWWLTSDGEILEPKKQTYGQAFVIYGFTEYFMATGNTGALNEAIEVFRLMEEHNWKAECGGYWEATDRQWNLMEDVRLSEKDMNAPFSMNTHLHVMEGYTNLMLAKFDPDTKNAVHKILDILTTRILLTDAPRFGLFYDAEWNLLTRDISPGHDIEGSWLIWETAEFLADEELMKCLRSKVVQMADFVLENGVDEDGGVLNEYEPGKPKRKNKDWWPQAEGVVGFLNAFQMTGEDKYLQASIGVWQYIRKNIIDPVHGEWFAERSATGEVQSVEKAGPWKSAYHNGRMGFEVIKRVNDILKD